MRPRPLAGLTSVACAAAGYVFFGRTRQLRWGATDQECEMALSGDELIVRADLTATRAITVRAAAAEVWPWIAQLGRAGAGSTATTSSRTSSAATFSAPIASHPNGSTSRS